MRLLGMKSILLGSIVVFVMCQGKVSEHTNARTANTNDKFFDSGSSVLADRYLCPDSFFRKSYDTSSFQHYLSHLTLKPLGTLVKYYDGSNKPSEAYSSVVDMAISPVDLQQCADAVMRLRGEYLFKTKRYNEISFRFLGDGRMHAYLDYAGTDRSYKKFRKYMDYVFSYANTASLNKQMHSVRFSDMRIGDVLIKTGNPYGHAVIVVDMCYNSKGEKMYLLAQSYMPAQETQILRNPNGNGSSWYGEPNGSEIKTPEWTFDTTHLKRW